MTTTPRTHAGNHIAGEWLPGDACERLAITDPATAETLGSVPLSGRTEADRAVRAARAAFPAWRRTPVVERARVLFRLKALLDEHHDDLAVSLSREHGKNVAETRGEVQALGGAKNHMILLPDADPEMVADAVVGSVFGSAGQRCLAGSVVVGVGDVYEPMREGILDGAAGLRMGRGLDEGVDMGPVISGAHRDRVKAFIDEGERDGARLLMDGRGAQVPGYPRGHWVGPTVFEDVTPEMPIGREEVFGPVAGLARAPSLEAALELLAKSPYGNAASIFTQSGRAAREFRYRAGISMIGVNIGVAAPMAFFPFGGTRNSFYGDLKAQGRDAVSFYTDQRVVISRW